MAITSFEVQTVEAIIGDWSVRLRISHVEHGKWYAIRWVLGTRYHAMQAEHLTEKGWEYAGFALESSLAAVTLEELDVMLCGPVISLPPSAEILKLAGEVAKIDNTIVDINAWAERLAQDVVKAVD